MAGVEGAGPSHINDEEDTEIDIELVEDEEEGETAGSVPASAKGQLDLEPATYRLGRSKVTEAELDRYLAEGLIHPAMRAHCRAPGSEEVPRPKPYEAVVFRDFFKAGLRFPHEDFVGEVLQWFDLRIHHLTPNVFSRMCVFSMAHFPSQFLS
jgi:hypothetical protein